jgi:predicted DNA-binding transcriptional regulator YafY
MSPGSSAERLQRLLAMVPWVAAHDGPTVDEICTRFGITPAQLAADLEVVWLVGLPPYTPDALVDVVQEGDRVWIHYAEVFAAAHRLTPDQAVALLTAGASVLALPGADTEGALASGVAKLAEVLGVDAQQVLDIDLGAAQPEVVDVLRAGIAEARRVRLDYYTYGRDARTIRDVDPYLLQSQDGSLYLLGHCHLAGGQRLFRVDRIAGAALLDHGSDPPDGPLQTEVFRADDADPRVVLDLPADAAWVRDAYPVEAVEVRADGTSRVTLAVSAAPWLERLLLGLGPEARIVDGPPELAEGARAAATRILHRYR